MIHNLIGEKGGAASFKTSPDTLRSNDSFEMLLGLGSGRWKGLTKGLQSLEVNGVPLENADGTSNFKDFAVMFADGDPAQTQLVNFKLGGGGGTTVVNTQIGNINASGPGPWITAAVTTPGADFIDLRLVISSLYYQDAKGVRANKMSLEVEMRPNGAANWTNPLLSNVAPTYNQNGFNISDGGSGTILGYMLRQNWNLQGNAWNDNNPGYIVINDKTTSPAVKELRISVPNTGAYANKTWQVRIRMVERELRQADPVEERRTVQFESVAAVTKKTFGSAEEWRGLSWLQVVGKASEQISGVPSLRGIYETKIVKVPPSNVFNPDTRQYTSTLWNGSYVLSYTTDPAWCIKDLIEDPVSGIAALSPGATLDKWDALEASKYFSALVPDGKGGTHPRFSLNVKIDQAQNAEDMIQYLAGAVNALAVDTGDSQWRLKVDKPETPTTIFTRDNIIGEFQYSHTDVDARYNDYTVTFLNKENRYEEDRARVFDQAHIDRFGRKPTTVVALGANNRQEALRRAMYRLRVSTNENTLVNFVTNRQGLMVQPLSVILVADTDLGYVGSTNASGNRTTTRLKSASGTILILGSSIRLEVGVNYTINLTVPNPNYNPDSTSQPGSIEWQKPTLVVSRNVVNTAAQRGDVTILYVDAALPANTPSEAPIALSANGLPSLPIQYRVMEVTPSDDQETVTIQALIIDTGKWNAMDNVSETAILGQVSNTSVPAPVRPAGGIYSMRYFTTEYQTKRVLTVSWERPGSLFLAGFRVEYSFNGGPWRLVSENTQQSYVELQQPQSGDYTYRIASVDRRGRLSEYLSEAITITDTAEDYAPTQGVGPLADRPSFGSKEGEKYTTTDQNPNQTFIWHDGAWISESNYVDAADQIYYNGGDTVEQWKPADKGATAGAPAGSMVGDKKAEEIVADLSLNGFNALYATALATTKGAELDALKALQDGSALTIKIKDLTTVIENPDQNAIQTLNLIGAAQPDGKGGTTFVFNQNTAIGTPDKLLGETIDGIANQVEGHESSITAIKSIVTAPNGESYLKAMTVLNSEGVITGTINTLTGGRSEYAVMADEFRIVQSGPGGKAFTPFSVIDGVVTMLDVVVRKLSYEALVPLFGGEFNKLDPNSGFQVLPGGLIMQWGRVRQTINSEVTFGVTFPKAFPNGVMSVGAMPYLASFSNVRDLWLQNVGIPSKTGAVFGTQAATNSDRQLDGFDWWAWGY
jgi:predicted phage tail protein